MALYVVSTDSEQDKQPSLSWLQDLRDRLSLVRELGQRMSQVDLSKSYETHSFTHMHAWRKGEREENIHMFGEREHSESKYISTERKGENTHEREKERERES